MAKKIEAMKMKASLSEAAHAKSQADAAHHQLREGQSEKKTLQQNQWAREQDGARLKVSQRKLQHQEKRAWDMDKPASSQLFEQKQKNAVALPLRPAQVRLPIIDSSPVEPRTRSRSSTFIRSIPNDHSSTPNTTPPQASPSTHQVIHRATKPDPARPTAKGKGGLISIAHLHNQPTIEPSPWSPLQTNHPQPPPTYISDPADPYPLPRPPPKPTAPIIHPNYQYKPDLAFMRYKPSELFAKGIIVDRTIWSQYQSMRKLPDPTDPIPDWPFNLPKPTRTRLAKEIRRLTEQDHFYGAMPRVKNAPLPDRSEGYRLAEKGMPVVKGRGEGWNPLGGTSDCYKLRLSGTWVEPSDEWGGGLARPVDDAKFLGDGYVRRNDRFRLKAGELLGVYWESLERAADASLGQPELDVEEKEFSWCRKAEEAEEAEYYGGDPKGGEGQGRGEGKEVTEEELLAEDRGWEVNDAGVRERLAREDDPEVRKLRAELIMGDGW